MVQQLSVFLQNEAGKLASVTGALAAGGVDIRALSIADTMDFGVLRMLVSDVAAAKAILEREACIFSVTGVTVVAVPDQPGGLARVLPQEQMTTDTLYQAILELVRDGDSLRAALRDAPPADGTMAVLGLIHEIQK